MAERGLSEVGDHFFVGLRPGPTLDARDASLLHDLRPAGVILYKSNFHHDLPYETWLARHADYMGAVREACGRESLLVGIDHEGGRVCRTPPPITRFSYPSDWAGTSGAVGTAMGIELASLGVNVNFAPLLDIHSNPDNPVIGPRAFATEPKAVSRAAIDFMKAMEAAGVVACGKHFPGHGDAAVDSHYGLPRIDHDLETLRRRELVPFADAIGAGLSLMMTAHILFSALDPDIPATLSRRVVGGLLRDEMGYRGVVVSDDIGMHAMDGMFDDPNAAVRFIEAGNDMVMICAHWTDTERVRALARALAEARKNDGGFARTLEAAKGRIAGLLAAAPQHAVRPLAEEQFARDRLAGPLFGASTVEVI